MKYPKDSQGRQTQVVLTKKEIQQQKRYRYKWSLIIPLFLVLVVGLAFCSLLNQPQEQEVPTSPPTATATTVAQEPVAELEPTATPSELVQPSPREGCLPREWHCEVELPLGCYTVPWIQDQGIQTQPYKDENQLRWYIWGEPSQEDQTKTVWSASTGTGLWETDPDSGVGFVREPKYGMSNMNFFCTNATNKQTLLTALRNNPYE